jgi:iron complex outermembrane receptor protein
VGQWFKGTEGLGTFKFAFDSQYLLAYDQTTPTADGSGETTEFAGRDAGDNPLPRFKANTTLSWTRNDWQAAWMVRFIRGTTEDCVDGLSPSFASLGLCSNPDSDLSDGTDDSTNDHPDIFYHNVQVGYSVPGWNTELVFGVINLFDQDPPVSYSAFANSAPATLYETWGSRQPYLRLNVQF